MLKHWRAEGRWNEMLMTVTISHPHHYTTCIVLIPTLCTGSGHKTSSQSLSSCYSGFSSFGLLASTVKEDAIPWEYIQCNQSLNSWLGPVPQWTYSNVLTLKFPLPSQCEFYHNRPVYKMLWPPVCYMAMTGIHLLDSRSCICKESLIFINFVDKCSISRGCRQCFNIQDWFKLAGIDMDFDLDCLRMWC